MKRLCKKVDIFDRAFIERAVRACLAPGKKRRRADTVAYFADIAKCSLAEAREFLVARDARYDAAVLRVVEQLRDEMLAYRLRLGRVFTQHRKDPSSGKVRRISILHIKQLLFDHVAVLGLAEVQRRVGVYQCSGYVGKEAHYGARAVRRWLRGQASRYAVQMDISHYFESIDHERLMAFLAQRVKNDDLLWLVRRLIGTCKKGLHVGSYLSQTLANLYLSGLYHEVGERMRARNGKRLVSHVLFYMDDFLLVGTNKRHLQWAAERVVAYAAQLGLVIKPGWRVFRVARREELGGRPVDMMGFRFYRNVVTIRRRIFLRARRMLLRVMACVRGCRQVPVSMARRCLTYKGYFDFSNCARFMAAFRARFLFKVAAMRVSLAER